VILYKDWLYLSIEAFNKITNHINRIMSCILVLKNQIIMRKRVGTIKLNRFYLFFIFCAICLSPIFSQEPPTEALKVPGAKPTLSVTVAKAPFEKSFVDEARKYFSNFHMELGGDHALYCTTHMSEFMPAALAMPKGNVRILKHKPSSGIGEVTFTLKDGSSSQPLNEYINAKNTRVLGVMVLHNGKVVYDAYPGIEPERQHIWASVSKTVVGTLLTML
jgi:hypothetical protein